MFICYVYYLILFISVYIFRSKTSELQDIIIKSNANGMALDPEKVDQYVKAMSIAGSEKVFTFKNQIYKHMKTIKTLLIF